MKMIYNVNDRPPFGKLVVFSLQQLLAIITATIAVPMVVSGSVSGEQALVMNPAAAMIGAGFGTITYLLFTKFKSPVFLGSSFAFISPLIGAVTYGYFGVLLGAALAIMLKSCGTSGGTTVLASLVNKKFRNLSVSGMTAVFDAVVVFASFFVYNQGMGFTAKLEPVLLALISLFVTSKVCDVILQGFKAAYRFEIITNHPEEISAQIMEKLHHGVTEVNATGMYSHEDRAMLVCIIRKRQIGELQRILRQYPETFASFTPASEVYGKFLK